MLSTEHGLPDKQRVAFGRFVDGGDLRLRRGATPKIAYPVETAAAPGLAMRSGAAKMPRQKLQQQERGIIGRMQIDEDQKQRPHRGGVLEEPGGRLEQVEAPPSDSRDAAAGAGDPRRSARAIWATSAGLGYLGAERGDLPLRPLVNKAQHRKEDSACGSNSPRCSWMTGTRPAPPQRGSPATDNTEE
jgi:hypothetical protein